MRAILRIRAAAGVSSCKGSVANGVMAALRDRRAGGTDTLAAMKVLGIESSCDETGVALLELDAAGAPRLLGDALHSQAEMHRDYGGVVPELASRDHIRRVVPLLRDVLAQAGCEPTQVDVVAYTRGPGLAGALLVGAGVATAVFSPANEKSSVALRSSGLGSANAVASPNSASRASAGPPG